jgi:FkbM family methyltransferase
MRWKRYHRYVSGYWLGIHEPEIQKVLAAHLKLGGVFYDIGANAGFFTLLASKLVGPAGAAFAFEPLPQNADVLAEQLSLNGLPANWLVRAAVGDRGGSVSFAPTDNTSTAGIVTDAGSGSISVQMITLDEFVIDHPPPTFLKIDVEGAEGLVIAGAAEVIRRHRPAMLVEVHSPAAAEATLPVLKAAGYHVTALGGGSTDTLSYETPAHVLGTCG